MMYNYLEQGDYFGNISGVLQICLDVGTGGAWQSVSSTSKVGSLISYCFAFFYSDHSNLLS